MAINPENTRISMKARGKEFSRSASQIDLLTSIAKDGTIPSFVSKIKPLGHVPLKPTGVDILQVNVGKMCNQTCKHCHVDAGPDRKEIMTRDIMQYCIDAVKKFNIATVDLTGGAPEMNPDFRWFVEGLKEAGAHVLVRCNLTIITANKKYNDLPEFFAKHKIEVVSSLPYYNARRTDAQRGDGVFEASITALKMLNEIGYGMPGTDLTLNLVYNPTGAFLPAGQDGLEKDFKRSLRDKFGIEFNNLFAITNLPISRFLEYLVASKNYESYMEKLVAAFNPATVEGVMCRTTISVSWDGHMYDCDFNQMLDLKVARVPSHIKDFDLEALTGRNIVVNQHCYGCTAGAGSSCGGEVV